MSYDILLVNFGIVANLKIYDKLNVNDDILYIDSGIFQAFVRYYYDSNRIKTLAKLTSLIGDLSALLGTYKIGYLIKLSNPPPYDVHSNNKHIRAKLAKYRAEKKGIDKNLLIFASKLDIIWPNICNGFTNLIFTYQSDADTAGQLMKLKQQFVNMY